MDVSQGLSIINTSNAKQELAELVSCGPCGSSAALPTCLAFAQVESTNTGGALLN